MTADFVIVQGLNGIAYGLLLFLLAAGLSLIFGMMDVVNLAHGSFFMLGAYIGYTAAKASHNFWLALVVAPIAVGVLGVGIEVLLLKRLYRRPLLDQVILTFGLSFMAAELVKIIWGTNELVLQPPDIFSGPVTILGNTYPVYRLFVIAIGLLIAFALWLIERRTRIGAIVRAGVADRQMVAGLGVNIGAVFTGVFAFGAALAAFGGVVAGPVLSLFPGVDAQVLINALIVVVVGGMGSLTGAFWGGLLIGIAVTFLTILVPAIALVLTFLVMGLILLVRPNGLFGMKLH
ncbi:MAG: branched-chain amino acid ABC transporter permease [Chloroflexi bacterium]|nr:branched-chain amino acid ABC transporter permease [Chloroflexota bacterium]MBV9899039.1 branched-chain amino acid ABC transporter permease [Chloroflexota bacterium]